LKTFQTNAQNGAIIPCKDGNDKVLKQQRIPFIDFEPEEATVWVELGDPVAF